jgi:hypothetical protein
VDRYLIVLLAAVVAVAGCTDIVSNNNNDKPQDVPESSSEGKGLEIVSFDVTDNTLIPEQEAIVRLTLKNHHIDPITLESIQLYNLGMIGLVENSGDISGCSSTEIRAASQGHSPEINCDWRVMAPAAEELGDFESRNMNPKLRVAYDSVMSNKKNTLPVTFKPLSEIGETRKVTKTYSNDEVSLKLSVDTPVPLDGQSTLDIVIDTKGDGRLNSPYTVQAYPKSIMGENCASEIQLETVATDRAELSCVISTDASNTITRNLMVSTSYKYQKYSSLNIEVVNE